MLHDLMHTLGIVSRSAPNHTVAYPAHVPEPTDLMYSGPSPWRYGGAMVVDVGGDDYQGPNVAPGLPTIGASPYIAGDVPLLATVAAQAGPLIGASLGARLAVGALAASAEPWRGAPNLPPHPPFPLERR